ncbi:unnamed protein product, partial [Mesorhabditis belari]|uniref:Uncharacterized protein n=1 Tax=Mesorhabditis belari TaxID=2138241 RepID=A0AAF3JAG4_9BILA
MAYKFRSILVIILATLFVFQLILYFYSSGSLKGVHKWRRRICDCENEQNCYSHPQDDAQCGKCFYCNKDKIHQLEPITAETAIMIVTNEDRMSQLLVLISSIHKYYPERKILIYNNYLSPKTAIRTKLTGVRNVEMFEAFDIPGLLSSQPLNNFAFTPFYIMHALAQYSNVLLIWDGMEILSDKLEPLLLENKNPITLFGKQSLDDPQLLGFSAFFPMAQFYPKNFTVAHFKDGSRSIIEWLMKCGGTTDCYDCRNVKGYAIDCLPFLLARLSGL